MPVELSGRWADLGPDGRSKIEKWLKSILKTKYYGVCVNEKDDLKVLVTKIVESGKNYGDCSWSLCFATDFLSRLYNVGFLPIATKVYGPPDELVLLLPKLHQERCFIRFEDIVVKKTHIKLASKYKFTVNKDFEGVIDGCHGQHGIPWLHPPIVKTFRELHKAIVHSIEIWEKDELIAGELGMASGSVYTSLSGFYNKSGSGSVQMAALSGVLKECGYTLWDLGMKLRYKMEMGAQIAERPSFVRQFNEAIETRAKKELKDFALQQPAENARVHINFLVAFQEKHRQKRAADGQNDDGGSCVDTGSAPVAEAETVLASSTTAPIQLQ